MKHFFKKHRYHFGLWLFSALMLVASTFWLKNLTDDTLGTVPLSRAETPTISTSTAEKIASSQQLKNQPGNPAPAPAQAKPLSPSPAEPISSTSPPSPLPLQPENLSENLEKKIQVAFQIKAPDWSKDLTMETSEQSTVYEAMRQLNERGLLTIVFKQFSGLGAFVQSINGLENSGRDNKFWIYYINDKPAALGVSSIKLNPNDIITWKFEEGKF